MMQQGQQKISRIELTRLLRKAREELAAELAFARTDWSEFIERVEHRSSLLMMTGHDVVDGTLSEIFEFRHLTFQEYLTAKAIVEGWYPGRAESDSLVSLLTDHVNDDKWREIIPLAAVLAGRRADDLVTQLADLVHEASSTEAHSLSVVALGNCLADEVQVPPNTVKKAIGALVRHGVWLQTQRFMPHLMRGKYGVLFREEAGKFFVSESSDYKIVDSGSALSEAVYYQDLQRAAPETVLSRVQELVGSRDLVTRCEGELGLMFWAYKEYGSKPDRVLPIAMLERACVGLERLLHSQETCEQFACCWALAWMGRAGFWHRPADSSTANRLIALWLHDSHADVRGQAAWAFSALPLVCARQSTPSDEDKRRFLQVADNYDSLSLKEREATIILSYCLGEPWDLNDILARAEPLHRSLPSSYSTALQELLSLHKSTSSTLNKGRPSRPTPDSH